MDRAKLLAELAGGKDSPDYVVPVRPPQPVELSTKEKVAELKKTISPTKVDWIPRLVEAGIELKSGHPLRAAEAITQRRLGPIQQVTEDATKKIARPPANRAMLLRNAAMGMEKFTLPLEKGIKNTPKDVAALLGGAVVIPALATYIGGNTIYEGIKYGVHKAMGNVTQEDVYNMADRYKDGVNLLYDLKKGLEEQYSPHGQFVLEGKLAPLATYAAEHPLFAALDAVAGARIMGFSEHLVSDTVKSVMKKNNTVAKWMSDAEFDGWFKQNQSFYKRGEEAHVMQALKTWKTELRDKLSTTEKEVFPFAVMGIDDPAKFPEFSGVELTQQGKNVLREFFENPESQANLASGVEYAKKIGRNGRRYKANIDALADKWGVDLAGRELKKGEPKAEYDFGKGIVGKVLAAAAKDKSPETDKVFLSMLFLNEDDKAVLGRWLTDYNFDMPAEELAKRTELTTAMNAWMDDTKEYYEPLITRIARGREQYSGIPTVMRATRKIDQRGNLVENIRVFDKFETLKLKPVELDQRLQNMLLRAVRKQDTKVKKLTDIYYAPEIESSVKGNPLAYLMAGEVKDAPLASLTGGWYIKKENGMVKKIDMEQVIKDMVGKAIGVARPPGPKPAVTNLQIQTAREQVTKVLFNAMKPADDLYMTQSIYSPEYFTFLTKNISHKLEMRTPGTGDVGSGRGIEHYLRKPTMFHEQRGSKLARVGGDYPLLAYQIALSKYEAHQKMLGEILSMAKPLKPGEYAQEGWVEFSPTVHDFIIKKSLDIRKALMDDVGLENELASALQIKGADSQKIIAKSIVTIGKKVEKVLGDDLEAVLRRPGKRYQIPQRLGALVAGSMRDVTGIGQSTWKLLRMAETVHNKALSAWVTLVLSTPPVALRWIKNNMIGNALFLYLHGTSVGDVVKAFNSHYIEKIPEEATAGFFAGLYNQIHDYAKIAIADGTEGRIAKMMTNPALNRIKDRYVTRFVNFGFEVNEAVEEVARRAAYITAARKALAKRKMHDYNYAATLPEFMDEAKGDVELTKFLVNEVNKAMNDYTVTDPATQRVMRHLSPFYKFYIHAAKTAFMAPMTAPVRFRILTGLAQVWDDYERDQRTARVTKQPVVHGVTPPYRQFAVPLTTDKSGNWLYYYNTTGENPFSSLAQLFAGPESAVAATVSMLNPFYMKAIEMITGKRVALGQSIYFPGEINVYGSSYGLAEDSDKLIPVQKRTYAIGSLVDTAASLIPFYQAGMKVLYPQMTLSPENILDEMQPVGGMKAKLPKPQARATALMQLVVPISSYNYIESAYRSGADFDKEIMVKMKTTPEQKAMGLKPDVSLETLDGVLNEARELFKLFRMQQPETETR
ncbi:MAG: hypothetical protein WC449_05450 [Candidatus Paceibacterota bacterium]